MTEKNMNVKTNQAKPENNVNVMPERRINKWVYILLAVFLGGLGLHNFYAGKTMLGIIWLVLFVLGFLLSFIGVGVLLIGMLWVVGIIQAIIALFKSSDANGCIAA